MLVLSNPNHISAIFWSPSLHKVSIPRTIHIFNSMCNLLVRGLGLHHILGHQFSSLASPSQTFSCANSARGGSNKVTNAGSYQAPQFCPGRPDPVSYDLMTSWISVLWANDPVSCSWKACTDTRINHFQDTLEEHFFTATSILHDFVICTSKLNIN